MREVQVNALPPLSPFSPGYIPCLWVAEPRAAHRRVYPRAVPRYGAGPGKCGMPARMLHDGAEWKGVQVNHQSTNERTNERTNEHTNEHTNA